MKRILALLCLLVACVPALAQSPGFPQNMPPNTVYGRSAIGTGPGQAIPFSVLNQNLLSTFGTPTLNSIPVSQTPSPAVWTSPTSWFDAAYCNTVGYLIVRLTSAWTCAQNIPVNPVWFGADPTGNNDSTTAINNAVTASTTAYLSEKQIYIRFPPGFFKINSQISVALGTTIGAIRIEGAGPTLTSLWFPNASTGLLVDLGTSESAAAHVRDMSFVTSGVGTSTGLTVKSSVTGSNYTIPITDLTNLDFLGISGYGQGDFFSTAVTLNGVSNVVVQNLNVYGGGAVCVLSLSNACGTGLLIEQNSSNIANNFLITGGTFFYLSAGINGVGDIEGLTVQQTSFLTNSVGILSTVSTGLTLQWGIGPNNNFTDVFTDIKVVNPVNGLYVNSNLFLILNAGQVGLSVGATINNGPAIVIGNYFGCSTTSTTKGIYIGSSTANEPSTVIGNVVIGCGTGIQTDTGSALVTVLGNGLSSNTTPVSNSGTPNVIAYNSGYNPVGYTAGTSTGISTSVITAGASPETHYITQSANFNAVVAKCTLLACGTSTNLCTVPSATVPCVLDLGPNESYKVTWSTTQPTYTKDIH